MAETEDEVVLDAPRAHLAGWLLIALVNAGHISTLRWPKTGIGVRLLHHLFDAGQLLALGLISAAVAFAWQRWAPRGKRARLAVGFVGLSLLSFGVGQLVARQSLLSFAERLAAPKGWEGEGDPEPHLTLLVAALASGIPLASLIGRLCARRWFRLGAVVAAVAAGVANEYILNGGYPGAHFYVAWAAATLAGGALVGAPWRGLWLRHPERRRRLLQRAAWVSSTLWAIATVSVWPSPGVLTELFKLDAAVLPPVLADIRDLFEPDEGDEDFGPVEPRPDVPPSAPPLLPARSIVILITIDALRADVLAKDEWAGHVPNLRKLCDEGACFSHARAPSPATRPSLATVFTGRYFSQLPWRNPSSIRPVISGDNAPRLPELLVSHGVRTAQFVAEYRTLVPETGIARGFQEQELFRPDDARGSKEFEVASVVMEKLIERVTSHKKGPLFVYTHLMDPHAPYDGAGIEGRAWDRYLGEVGQVDAAIGQLREAIAGAGLEERTALIVSADHGEAHGDHGVATHGGTALYEALVRVPLIIHVPGTRPVRVDAPVSLIDLGPTVLDLMGVTTPGMFMGESLVPYLRGETPVHTRPIALEASKVRGLVTSDNYKVIIDRKMHREQIFNLTDDPDEEYNLREALGTRGDEMVREVRRFFQPRAYKGPVPGSPSDTGKPRK